jgi:hypothetical protein
MGGIGYRCAAEFCQEQSDRASFRYQVPQVLRRGDSIPVFTTKFTSLPLRGIVQKAQRPDPARGSISGPEIIYRGMDADFKKADDRVKLRNEWFLALVRETQIAVDAWIISSPGCDTVTPETLQISGFPDELIKRGYPLREIEGSQRILHTTLPATQAIKSAKWLVPIDALTSETVRLAVQRMIERRPKNYIDYQYDKMIRLPGI